ncbi:MAG: CvpA family protein [Rickettsiales bacterium]|jgi:membrane protein required for colicin V production|nr:CvpA family protein [Rickettsiales bacterium]
MFDLTIMDYVYIGILLVSTIWASVRGGVYETVATISWIAAALMARFVSPLLDGLFQGWFNLSESTIGSLVASYFIVFFVILVLFGFINQKLRDKVQDSMLNVTDHAFGIVFGIIRAVAVMGLVYWVMLWYYSDMVMPNYLANARTRPVMQLAADKIFDWFIPGQNKLLENDMATTTINADSGKLYKNLVNPAVKKSDSVEKNDGIKLPKNDEVGYRESERKALDNQLLKIESKE